MEHAKRIKQSGQRMGKTRAASRFLNGLGRIYNDSVLALLVRRGEEIARERGAPRLGRNHLVRALESYLEQG